MIDVQLHEIQVTQERNLTGIKSPKDFLCYQTKKPASKNYFEKIRRKEVRAGTRNEIDHLMDNGQRETKN